MGLARFVTRREGTYGPFKRNVSSFFGPSGAQLLFGVRQSWGLESVSTQGERHLATALEASQHFGGLQSLE